jgi:prophage antirepressor-like protein
VCRVLEIENPRNVSSRLDDDERDAVQIVDAMGRPQLTTVVSEPGLYKLIGRSNKPAARRFDTDATWLVKGERRRKTILRPNALG